MIPPPHPSNNAVILRTWDLRQAKVPYEGSMYSLRGMHTYKTI